MKTCVITSAKTEELYIEEWVKHNLKIGFDKIIINDNNDKDYPYKLNEILKEYINNGQVIIENYYDNHKLNHLTQEQDMGFVYSYLYKKYKTEFDWFAKLDIDEYLMIPETFNNVKLFLSNKRFDKFDAIYVPWKCYEIKNQYKYLYERTPHIYDKFKPIKDEFCDFYEWSFKSLFKGNLDTYVTHHTINIDKNYCYPNGDVCTLGKYNYDEKIDIDKKYFIKMQQIAHIDHFNVNSFEERYNEYYKMELYKIDGKCENENKKFKYICDKLFENHPELKDNKRDLYKIYFLNK